MCCAARERPFGSKSRACSPPPQVGFFLPCGFNNGARCVERGGGETRACLIGSPLFWICVGAWARKWEMRGCVEGDTLGSVERDGCCSVCGVFNSCPSLCAALFSPSSVCTSPPVPVRSGNRFSTLLCTLALHGTRGIALNASKEKV